jgi:hypothetical protein
MAKPGVITITRLLEIAASDTNHIKCLILSLLAVVLK